MDTNDTKKSDVLKALEISLGVVTSACRKANISRTTFYKWLGEDPDFARQVKDIEDVALDFVESQLFKQIKDNNVASTIFYLKTKGKNRGYMERQEISGPNGEPVQPFQIIIPPKPD